jgi:chromate transporter
MQVLERVVESTRLRQFLLGVTAGVVGLIGATAVQLGVSALTQPLLWAIFGVSLLVLFRSNARWLVPTLVLGSGVIGLVHHAL